MATPRIGYVYPAGGRQGTTFQVKLGGQFLEGVTNAYVSGGGVRATVLQHTKPLTPQQFTTLRERMRELQEKRQAIAKARRQGTPGSTNLVWTAGDEKTLAEIRVKLANFQRRPANPAIAETVTLQVAVEADAEPGEREVRLWTPQGLSNPLLFCVGQLPEVRKAESSVNNLGINRRALRNPEEKAVAPTEMNITIPVVVNGQILPGGVDHYRFHARQGQKLVIAASARELIPYIPDAVPGWFQATLTLQDAKGKELAYSDAFRFNPDPVIYFEVHQQGEYVVEIKDSVYRGREDFVYRITISESPFVTSVFPLGGPAGKPTDLELRGWNLPAASLKITLTNNAAILPVTVSKGKLVSNRVPVALGTLPECTELGSANSRSNAQAISLPVVVNGRLNQPGEGRVFRFDGRGGQEIVAEVYARRLNSPLDSTLKLTDATGRQLAFNDDHEDKGFGLNTHHADSYIRTKLPADGTYYLELRDAQRQGGPEFGYRLRVSPPEPDFELRVAPSSINVRAGLSAQLTVYALRKDGFTNEISLALGDAPAGFSLSGARIPAGRDEVRLTLSAPALATKEPAAISIEGRARIGGKFFTRKAVPAEDMMQAFAYRHLVPARELEVAATGRMLPRVGFRLASSQPVKIPAGGTARVRVAGPAAAFIDRFDFELNDPPEGLAINKVSAVDGGAEIVLQSDSGKTKPGLQGNLIVGLVPGRNVAAKKAKKQANTRRVSVGMLPAIPFEVVEAK